MPRHRLATLILALLGAGDRLACFSNDDAMCRGLWRTTSAVRRVQGVTRSRSGVWSTSSVSTCGMLLDGKPETCGW